MKIALIGAEGSGKTEFAEAFTTEYLDKQGCADCRKKQAQPSTIVIDNYVDDIGTKYDLAVGGGASYIGNLAIIMGRLQLERNVQGKVDNLITCGTLIESSIYAVVDAVRGQSEAHWLRVTTLMNMIGSIYADTWDYDEAFVFSLEDPDETTISGQVDKHLMMAVNQFALLYTPLAGSVDQRVATAIETIEEHQREPTPGDFSNVVTEPTPSQ
jgi:hypothetical protein